MSVAPSAARFFYSAPAPCPYLPGRVERRIFADLTGPRAPHGYDLLSEAGFRRSLGFAYRPACPGCNACVAVRIPAAEFTDDRKWRRVRRANADLAAVVRPALATAEQYGVFERYQQGRHADGEMARMDFADFRTMVEVGTLDSQLIEFRDAAGTLIGGCLVDRLGVGLSAVYSFYDPEHNQRSLGSYMILWLVDECRRLGLPHVYLGYWIAECRKMAYKTRFRPIEALTRDGWRRIGPEDEIGEPSHPSRSR
jgi:arginyl-tRNA--protein-N-Asp/Glu arginylyltransferase